MEAKDRFTRRGREGRGTRLPDLFDDGSFHFMNVKSIIFLLFSDLVFEIAVALDHLDFDISVATLVLGPLL